MCCGACPTRPGSCGTGADCCVPAAGFVLIEGVWGTVSPAYIPADRLTELLAPLVSAAGQVRVERLSDDPLLWGRAVDDERYAVVAVP